MLSFPSSLPPWSRTLTIALLMGAGAVLILFPAWLPDHPTLPVEDSTVELLQAALLGFSAALFFATSSHAGPFDAIYRASGAICVAALIAEIGDAIDGVLAPTGLSHHYLLAVILIWTVLTLARHRREFLRFVGFAARHPSSGFVISAIILIQAFGRVFGSDVFWSATLNGKHHPNTPQICQAYLELLACYFILLGAIGFCLPLSRRRYRMVTEP